MFFTNSGWWVAAENLKAGDKVITASGDIKEIVAVEFETASEPVKIYNLNVQDYHTYFVGSQQMLVHNDCTADMMAAGREAIQAAKLKGITDANTLSGIGEAAAEEATTIMRLLSEADTIAEQGLKLSGDALKTWIDSIWSMADAKKRGMIIESYLSKTDYSTWGFMGRESGGYWKGFDFADDFSGTISSLKTLDPRLSSYVADGGYTAIKGYIDSLYDLGRVTMANGTIVAKKALDVRIPVGTIGSVARDRLKDYIHNIYNDAIELIIKEF